MGSERKAIQYRLPELEPGSKASKHVSHAVGAMIEDLGGDLRDLSIRAGMDDTPTQAFRIQVELGARSPFHDWDRTRQFKERIAALEAERDAALERVRELAEWRPPATAPKDEKLFVALLRCRGWGKAKFSFMRELASWWGEDARPGENDFCDHRGDPLDNKDFEFVGWLPLPPAPETK